MGIQIRAATDADLPSILALYVQVEDDGRILPVERARSIFARIHSYPDYTVYVATFDGLIVGTFALLIMDNLAHMGAPSGVLEDFVVQGDWQHRGVGKEMMQFVMDRCRKTGCYKLALSSNLKREAAHGFSVVSVFDDTGIALSWK